MSEEKAAPAVEAKTETAIETKAVEVGPGESIDLSETWENNRMDDFSEKRIKEVSELTSEKRDALQEVANQDKKVEELKQNLEGEKENGKEKEKQKSEDKSDKEEEVKEQKGQDKEEVKPESFKASLNDELIEYAKDALLDVKVDGKKVQVALKDLVSNYSGEQAWSKKFNALDKEKRQFQADRNQVVSVVDGFFERAKKKDFMGALAVLAESGGLNPVEFLNSFNEQMESHYSQYAKMSNEQRVNANLQLKNKWLEESQSHKAARQAEVANEQDINDRIEKVVEKTGATRENLLELMKSLQEQGVDAKQITPEVLGQQFLEKKAMNEAVDILEEINPELVTEGNVEKIWKAKQLNPDFSKQDLTEIAKEVFAKDKASSSQSEETSKNKAKTLSAKVQKSQPERIEKQIENKVSANVPLTFDDIDMMMPS